MLLMQPRTDLTARYCLPAFLIIVHLLARGPEGCFYWFVLLGEHSSASGPQEAVIDLNVFPEIMGARKVGHWERRVKGGMKLFVPGSAFLLLQSRTAGRGFMH